MADILDTTKSMCCPAALSIPQTSVGFSPRPYPHPTARNRALGKPATPGVSGTALCRNDHRHRDALRTMPIPGSHGKRDAVGCSGCEAGRRSREQRGRRPFNQPPRDHAARATPGRRRRPGRPEPPETAFHVRTRVRGTSHRRVAPRTMSHRAPTGSAPLTCSSGSEGGRRSRRRRGHSRSSHPLMTTPPVRRWVARGGPEGRSSG